MLTVSAPKKIFTLPKAKAPNKTNGLIPKSPLRTKLFFSVLFILPKQDRISNKTDDLMLTVSAPE